MVNGVKCFTKVQENRGSNQTVISVFKNVVGKESQSSAGRYYRLGLKPN
jgi:hypothetical protein